MLGTSSAVVLTENGAGMVFERIGLFVVSLRVATRKILGGRTWFYVDISGAHRNDNYIYLRRSRNLVTVF